MAKVNFNGMEFEGTPEELAVLFAEMEKRQGTIGIADPTPKEETLKVGDYAKITNADKLTLGGFKVGDIVELHRSRYGEFDEDYYVKTIDDNKVGYAPKNGGYVVKLTEDEVTAIKEEIKAKEAQRKLELKWADLGRKVNEFKSGDIVSGERTLNEGEIVAGILDRGEPDVNGNFGVDTYGGDYRSILGHTIELITPVEARFDR